MRRELLLLREMIDAADRIREVIGDLDLDGLRGDSLRRDAVLWNYTVLGEASGQVPDEVKQAHPGVGWAQATRLRNRIVHGYWDVDLQILHDTATEDPLFAALEIATGQVTAALKPKHRHQEFLAFLRQIERTYRHAVDPETGEPVELHLVMDNYAAHKHAKVKQWLADHPRFVVHFTPTHASWMNLVEVWFGLVERQAVRRGVFKSVKDLNGKLRAYIEGWNTRAHPFVWTKTADEILKKANRPTTSNPRH